MEEVPILIVGGGPVGTLLSALLSRNYAIPNIVLERDTCIPPNPRAFSISADGIRAFQDAGISTAQIYRDLGAQTVDLHFVGGRAHDINATPFLEGRADVNTHTSHVLNIMFKQPRLEELLRGIIRDASVGSYRDGCEVVGMEEVEDGKAVVVTYQDIRSGEEKKVKARFAVGCDGRRGYVRKVFLEPKGVVAERFHPFMQIWAGCNWYIDPPTPESHPDFPLWKLGWTTDKVMDEFIPKDFKYLCHPDRKGAASRIGVPTDQPRVWRTEFEVLPGEDPETEGSLERVTAKIRPYMTHKGKRFGLKEDVTFPEDCMRPTRSWHYVFESKMCNKWYAGRVFLAGDAAHVFPPFGGLGVQMGLMDIQGLAWRLAIANRTENIDLPSEKLDALFDAWAEERKQAIGEALEYTMHNGNILMLKDPLKVFVRDWGLWLLQQIPGIREKVQRIPIDSPKYRYEEGMAFLPNLGGGKVFYQIGCKRVGDDNVVYTDDVIFAPEKKSMLQLLVLLEGVDDIPRALKDLDVVVSLSNDAKQLVDEATFLIHGGSVAPKSLEGMELPSQVTVAHSANSEEFASSSLLKARSAAVGYTGNEFKEQHGDRKYVIARRDRFIFATCRDKEELRQAVEAMLRVLRCEIA